MARFFLLVTLTAAALLPLARAEKPKAAEADAPWYIDDDEIYDDFMEKLRELAEDKKGLPADKLKELIAEDRAVQLKLPKPSAEKLDPEDVYRKVLAGVFLVGSVVPNKDKEKADDGKFLDGRLATAWVLTADGVLVTNYHVFSDAEDGETFGVMDHRGRAYPVTDVLAVKQAADIAVIKVDAKGLTPLPLAERAAPVGAWVGVLGHPGDRYFTFTQGSVSRYSKVKREDGNTERWMAITADYAYGSSGSPVLDRTGSVVGMAALTENLDYPEAEPIPVMPEQEKEKKPDPKKSDDKPDAKPEEPRATKGSSLQMVIKLTVPVGELRKTIVGK